MARPREVTDEEILAATRRVFLDHGPGAATSLIADELGVSSATLFHRFGSKRRLMLKALLPPPPPVDLIRYDPDQPLAAQLAPLAAMLARFPGNEDGLRCLMSAGFQPDEVFAEFDEPPPVSVLDALTRFFAAAQEHGAASSRPPRHLALCFMGALKVNHFFTHVCKHPALDDEDAYVRDVVELLTEAIG